MNAFWLGLATGIPLMISVGPIAVLLVEIGIARGVRHAWPAALGVATADLTFATIAAASGSALQRALHPYTSIMQWTAAALLLGLAVTMFRRSVREIRDGGAAGVAGPVETNPVATAPVATGALRLWARLLALTVMNPLTIIAFTSLVVATGARASNVGWPLGIASASILVHVGLVSLGSGLRRTLPPLGPSWLRVCGSVLIVGLATNLVLS